VIIKKYLFSLLVFLPLAVTANITANDTHIFNPTTGDSGLVTVSPSAPVKLGTLNTSLFISEALNSLPDTWDTMGAKIDSDDSVLFSDLMATYGLAENLEISAAFTYLWQQTTTRSESGAQFGGVGLNDIRFSTKYQFFKNEDFGAAFQTSANVNVAKNNPFVGVDSGPIFNFEGILDYIWKDFLIVGNLGYRLRQNGSEVSNSVFKPLPDYFVASAALRYFSPQFPVGLNFEIYAAKPVRVPEALYTEQAFSEVIVGGFFSFLKNFKSYLGYGRRTSDGLFTADERFYAGLSLPIELHPPPPPTPSEQDVIQPKPAITIVEVHNTFQGFQPAQIESMKSVPFDTLTQQHEFQLQTKIPSKDLPSKPPFEVLRLENFDFDFGSSEIRKDYAPLLLELANYLASSPKVLKVRIEGHTDSFGSEARNRKRSQTRADALKSYLKNFPELSDIPIDAIGFGSDKPIADNNLPEGRTKNRRVEVRILRQTPALQKSGTSQ
jgi:outer membrane protein OmpA-like peptidoglycan-associated protein